MRAIVQYSGGAASYVTAALAVGEFGRDNVVLLFADTLIEDEDLYRFNRDVEAHLGIKITRLCEGRTPWEVFFSERMMGNSGVDHCSRVLKRQMLDQWLEAHADVETDVVLVGMDANEPHRLTGLQDRVSPWKVRSLLIERGLWKEQVLQMVEAHGLVLPRLYKMGFPHNNCGGFCVKAGHGSFKLLLEKLPERYAEHEAKEEAFRRRFKKDVSILRDRTGGTTKVLTMRQLRERIQSDPNSVDRFDLGGCNCMTPSDEDEINWLLS